MVAAMLWTVPRKWAIVPLLLGCCYMTMGQGIALGPASLPVYRMLIAVGVLRVFIKGERIQGAPNIIDKMIIAWSAWVIIASFFHDGSPGSGPIYASGIVFNISLIYYLVRVWCDDLDSVEILVIGIAILLVPISIGMIMEKTTGKNPFAVFGGVPLTVLVREGKLRAQGPFGHPILAGTVGATCIPLFMSLFARRKLISVAGIASGLGMVVASASSGPAVSLGAGIFGLIMWRMRSFTGYLRIGGVICYFALMLVMTRPPYYLISKIDISGGSTGWHRCYLIEQTFNHLSEWWLFGTDQTRHWMPNQGTASLPNHTDITNYYIGFGVVAGLPAMIMLIIILKVGFGWVGNLQDTEISETDKFVIWCLGCGLFAHAITSISVAYFDQSLIFFWLNIAVISSMYSAQIAHAEEESEIDASLKNC